MHTHMWIPSFLRMYEYGMCVYVCIQSIGPKNTNIRVHVLHACGRWGGHEYTYAHAHIHAVYVHICTRTDTLSTRISALKTQQACDPPLLTEK